MTNPVPTAHTERAAVLIEKRLHAGLTPEEQAELDRLVAAHPTIAAELTAAEQEDRAMTALVQRPTASHGTPDGPDAPPTSSAPPATGDIPPFDFDRARRVIEKKLSTERGVLNSLAGWTLLTPPILIAISWPKSDWSLIAWCTALPATPITLWAIYRWRESVAFRKALATDAPSDPARLESAWARHIRRGRNEYAVMGACVAIVCVALVVWLIELIDKGAWPLVPFALIGASVMGYHGVRRLWSRRGREAHERELAGLDDTDTAAPPQRSEDDHTAADRR